MAKKVRPRTERRAKEREARELVRARQKLALLESGGSAERPIEVPSSSVIEPRASSLPCPLCGGGVAIADHQARTVGGRSLRVVSVICQRCGVGRQRWFRIGSPLPQ